MKVFVLFLQICSNVAGICSDYYTDHKELKSYKDCVLYGLNRSNFVIKELDSKTMDNERTIIKFHCLEQESKKV